jgi:uncharacterized membrane protein YqiK
MLETFLIALGSLLGLVLLLALSFKVFYKKVPNQGMVIIVNKTKTVDVYKTGGFVYPIIHVAELMDITRKRISIIRRANADGVNDEDEGLLCMDNVLADIKVDFYVAVNTEEDVIREVVTNFSVSDVNDISKLERYFSPKFSEALKTAAKKFDFEDLYEKRDEFRDAVKKIISNDLDGFQLKDVVIDKLEQSSLAAHRSDNMLHVDGKKKITERTATRHIETNEIVQNEETEIKRQDIDAQNTRLDLDRQGKEAEAKQDREVRIIESEENAAAKEKEEENSLREQKAVIKTEEQVGIETQNKEREIRNAELGKERVNEIEGEKVQRAIKVESVTTQTEVQSREQDMERTVEEKKKATAEVIAERTQIERKTAKEEEQTLDLRTKSEVDREKLVLVTNAEAKAEAEQTEKVKSAEADKKSAVHLAERDEIAANAALMVADKKSQGDKKEAEGVRATVSATGLAEVDVRLANSDAIKVEGQAEAVAIEAKGRANAVADTEQAKATEAEGKAKGVSVRAEGEAVAANELDLGLAKAKGETAHYVAINSIDADARKHDLDKEELGISRDVQLATVEVSKDIAESNASTISEALKNSNIDIVGGDSKFFEMISQATMTGKAIDAKYDSSDVMNTVMKEYREGGRSLPEDLKDILAGNDLSGTGLGSVLMAQLATNPDLKKMLTSALSDLGQKPSS